jgi:tyrosine-protein phosphatase SIW14
MNDKMNADTSLLKPKAGRRRLPVAVTVAIVVAIAIAVWQGAIKDRVVPKRFGVVEQGRIYRSGQLSASLVKRVLARHNIRVIVDLTTNDPNNPDQRAEIRAASELGIEIIKLPLGGNGTGDVNNYARAITTISQAERKAIPVLVHCAAGAQRTGGVIAAYRLLVQKKDPGFVIGELKRYGWSPKGNPALLPFLNSNMAELAIMLKQAGVINEIPAPLPRLQNN